ncbi:MAG: hypothetical protein AAF376_07670 [Pseudomonadota bacterium]
MTHLSDTIAALTRAGRVYTADAQANLDPDHQDAPPFLRLLNRIERVILPSEILCDLGTAGCIKLEAQNQAIRCLQALPSGLSRGQDGLAGRPLGPDDAAEVGGALQRWLAAAPSCRISTRAIETGDTDGHAGLSPAHLRDATDTLDTAPASEDSPSPFDQLCGRCLDGDPVNLDLNADAPALSTPRTDAERQLMEWTTMTVDRLLSDDCVLSDMLSTKACILFSRGGPQGGSTVMDLTCGAVRTARLTG